MRARISINVFLIDSLLTNSEEMKLVVRLKSAIPLLGVNKQDTRKWKPQTAHQKHKKLVRNSHDSEGKRNYKQAEIWNAISMGFRRQVFFFLLKNSEHVIDAFQSSHYVWDFNISFFQLWYPISEDFRDGDCPLELPSYVYSWGIY